MKKNNLYSSSVLKYYFLQTLEEAVAVTIATDTVD